MRLPFEDAAVGRAPLDEALVVAFVPEGLTAAVARHVLQHLRVPGGELVDRLDDVTGPREILLEGHGRERTGRGRLHRLNRDGRLRCPAALLGADDTGDEQGEGEQREYAPDRVPCHEVMVSLRRRSDNSAAEGHDNAVPDAGRPAPAHPGVR